MTERKIKLILGFAILAFTMLSNVFIAQDTYIQNVGSLVAGFLFGSSNGNPLTPLK